MHGAGAPPACALYATIWFSILSMYVYLVPPCHVRRCDQYCSSNVVSTITSLVDAIWLDVLTVVRLVAVCLGSHGLSGCICQMAVS
jgi:hypothetical protein